MGFRRLLIATAVATWALVVVGGIVRVSESGLGCPDWPLCHGRFVPAGYKEPIVEFSHRAMAALSIVLLVSATVWAWRRYRRRRELVVPLTVAAALVPFQAVLGAIVVWLELPDRLVGVHFMVGMTMLGLTTYAAAVAVLKPRGMTSAFRRTALALGAVCLLLVSLGASVVATDGMHACGEEWPACNGGVASGGRIAVLQVVHRSTGYLVLALALILLVLAVRARGPRLLGAAPACIVLAQIAFGVGIVLSGHASLGHDVFRILHVAGAATLWASAVAVATSALLPVPATDRATGQAVQEPVGAAVPSAGR